MLSFPDRPAVLWSSSNLWVSFRIGHTFVGDSFRVSPFRTAFNFQNS